MDGLAAGLTSTLNQIHVSAMDRKRALFLLVVLFSALYYVARIAIFYAGISGDMSFEEEQSALVENIVLYSFLLIGVAGLALLPGVYTHKTWGLWGTVTVSVYTIVFDVWALVAVQTSAGAGVVPAAVIAIYLVLHRGDFKCEAKGR